MMINASQRLEVRRLFFVYEDDPSNGKERPVVVALVDQVRKEALILKVTGHGPRSGFPGELRILDWAEAGLSKPSTIRCSKAAWVALDSLAASELYGFLSLRDSSRVNAVLLELGILS